MHNTLVRPEQRIERIGPHVTEQAELEQRVARASPAAGDQAIPIETSEQARLKDVVTGRSYEAKTEAQSKVASAFEVGERPDSFDSVAQRAKAEKFAHDFADKQGVDHVKADAVGDNWSKRAGADHHMNVAYELGPDEIQSFEDGFRPKSTGSLNRVDIVTQDGLAIECKTSWGDQASPSTVRSAYSQAEKRLEPNAEGKTYKGVVIVFPDGRLSGDAARVAQQYESYNPNIRFCEVHHLKMVLTEVGKGA
jgi:hypothetical protein